MFPQSMLHPLARWTTTSGLKCATSKSVSFRCTWLRYSPPARCALPAAAVQLFSLFVSRWLLAGMLPCLLGCCLAGVKCSGVLYFACLLAGLLARLLLAGMMCSGLLYLACLLCSPCLLGGCLAGVMCSGLLYSLYLLYSACFLAGLLAADRCAVFVFACCTLSRALLACCWLVWCVHEC